MQVKNINISKIKVKRGRRAVNKERVAQIAESISTLGLLHPISINKQYQLVTGRHRLEAYRTLGKKTIPAITTEKGLKADLMEIDENLIRQELSVLERAECLTKRKDIYETMYPESIKRGPGRGHRETKRAVLVSFTADSANKTGSSRRYIEETVQIAKNIPSDLKKMILKSDLADSKKELLKLARLDNKLQHKVVKLRLKNDDMSVDEIVKDLLIKKRVRDREKERKKRLSNSDSNSQTENIQLYHGDCRKLFPGIVKALKKENPDADIIVLSDPPYNINFAGYDKYSDNMPDSEYIDMMRMFKGLKTAIIQYPEEMMSLVYPALGKPDEVLAWCYNSNISRAFRLINIYNTTPDYNMVRQPYKNPDDKRVKKLIKHGSTGTGMYDWFADIQLEKNVTKGKDSHPCQIPIALMERLITLLTNESSIIIDPFCGIGSTGQAARNLGRRFVGIEISKKYFTMAEKRLAAF
jgi:DNA modification methylase